MRQDDSGFGTQITLPQVRNARRNACVSSPLLMGGLVYFQGKIFVLTYMSDVQVTIAFMRQDLLILLQNSQ